MAECRHRLDRIEEEIETNETGTFLGVSPQTLVKGFRPYSRTI